MKEKIVRLSGSLLIFLFLGYYAGITSFYHMHLIDGQVIVHSHPFRNAPIKDTPYQSHQHSSESCNLIHQMNQMNWSPALFRAFVPTPVCTTLRAVRLPDTGIHLHQIDRYISLRAPPAC